MLEDCAMEKKSSGRSVQGPAKGNCTELKKNQEVPGACKVYPRTSRRKEPTLLSTPRNDFGRRPTPQKARHLDKRPRSKGQCNSSGKEDTKVEDARAELDTDAHSGKKQNLNHLLNFHYAPRGEGGIQTHCSWRQSQAGWGRRSITTLRHKYNKKQFLQANCQFVVRNGRDYSENMANPDLLVEWDRIEQINFRTAESLSCPICLYPPSAAKMTHCGHIFCWPCILHYLALSDKLCRKCPICFEPVDKFDLKSVVVMKHTQYAVGDEIILRLMRRERGYLLPVPVEETRYHVHKKLLSVSEKDLDTIYSKLLVATPREVLGIIGRERTELGNRLITEEGCPEQCFTEQALELLKERELLLSMETLKKQRFPPTAELVSFKHPASKKSPFQRKVYQSSWDDEYTTSAKQPGVPACEISDDNEGSSLDVDAHCIVNRETLRQRFESVGSEGFSSEDGTSSLTLEDLEIPSLLQSASMASSTAPKSYYFYQAADGQHVYLHAVNVRMLVHQYGNLEHCPPTLKGRILEKEIGSMTEELRHRLRYLQHLPVTCQFEVIEILLRPPAISRNTIDHFQDQLEVRRRRRLHRARDERRREKRINDEQRRLIGRYPSPSLCLQSHRQFPLCGSEADILGFSVIPSSPTLKIGAQNSPVDDDVSSSASALNLEEAKANLVEDAAESASGPSFAQMLREGKSRGPFMGAPEEEKQALSMKQSVYPTCCSSDSEQEMEGYVPAPDHQQFLSDAIIKAMEEVAVVKQCTQGEVTSGKKKKKQKRKVLFATGMAYNNK